MCTCCWVLSCSCVCPCRKLQGPNQLVTLHHGCKSPLVWQHHARLVGSLVVVKRLLLVVNQGHSHSTLAMAAVPPPSSPPPLPKGMAVAPGGEGGGSRPAPPPPPSHSLYAQQRRSSLPPPSYPPDTPITAPASLPPYSDIMHTVAPPPAVSGSLPAPPALPDLPDLPSVSPVTTSPDSQQPPQKLAASHQPLTISPVSSVSSAGAALSPLPSRLQHAPSAAPKSRMTPTLAPAPAPSSKRASVSASARAPFAVSQQCW